MLTVGPGKKGREVNVDLSILQLKFCGSCLAGLALGDALGAPFEGARPADKAEVFAAAERRQVQRYTDDAHMAVGVADSLIACRDFDGSHMAGTFVRDFEREP